MRLKNKVSSRQNVDVEKKRLRAHLSYLIKLLSTCYSKNC